MTFTTRSLIVFASYDSINPSTPVGRAARNALGRAVRSNRKRKRW